MEHGHVLGPSEEGGVVLDIGGDIGAAVVHAPASLGGSEIEIRVHGRTWDGTHVAVRERRTPGGVTFAALFYGLSRGSYEVRVRDDKTGPMAPFEVKGGRVTEAYLTSPCKAAH
jgi:hypothetical protein